jgi:hypothetical protein
MGIISSIFHKFGYSIEKSAHEVYKTSHIVDPKFHELLNFCKPYTMTSIERMYGLYNAMDYIQKHNIPGSIVECGVWRGGSAMLAAKYIKDTNGLLRDIYLYDTYEGMSEPTAMDKDLKGESAQALLASTQKTTEANVWCFASVEDVKQNMRSTAYPDTHIHQIVGKVEDTLPANLPKSPIALLRLDTDWYESTKHELEHLFPLLQPGFMGCSICGARWWR